jgi:hypothetical protein
MALSEPQVLGLAEVAQSKVSMIVMELKFHQAPSVRVGAQVGASMAG